MIPVFVTGFGRDTERFIQLGEHVQERFSFTQRPHSGAVRLRIADSRGNSLFWACRERGVTLSAWQSEGICHYTGLGRDAFFLVCSLLGLTQWQALVLNPLLVEEDFGHGTPSTCLFSTRPFKQDYALLFEEPRVCGGCLAFFRCLGAEPEVEALRQGLALLNTQVETACRAEIAQG